MLGQHPQLYGFPELNLFVVETVKELWQLGDGAESTANSYIAGLLRTIAQLSFGCQTDDTISYARDWLSSRTHWSTRQMFDYLLAQVHPLIGVDKSPRTSLSAQSLQRALSGRPGVRVIHLTRHPLVTLRSLHDNHIRSVPGLASSASSLRLYIFYANLWVQSQEMIMAALQRLGSSQSLQLRAEDLLSQPHIHLLNLTRWLDINSEPKSIERMKHPEQSPYAYPAPLKLEGDGDPHFLLSPALQTSAPPSTILLPHQWKLDSTLATKMDNLSRRLGYGSIF